MALDYVDRPEKIAERKEAEEEKKPRKIPIKLPPGMEIPPKTIPHRPSPSLLNDFILEALAYKSMYDREDEVERAHTKTFDWVFESKANKRAAETRLSEWLSGDTMGPIYWVTGKPGSGKSTFIQYLFQHEKTAACLEDWTGETPVCTAGFFFWTSGSREQRSQTGLLRSLLHQVLSEHPDMIAASFPSLWERLMAMSTKERIKVKLDWSVEELLDAFRQFTTLAEGKMKVCLFVDGLDEFEGDHEIIIRFFREMSEKQGLKLCLSSRPWEVFEKAFESSVPNLKLQDVSFDDMFQFVSDKLKLNKGVKAALQVDEKGAQKLVQSTVQKADGVFLWVRLAVERMVALFDANAGLASLQHTLSSLPGELDDLFAKFIFQDQNDVQISQTATVYLLTRARELAADFIRDDSATALTVWELAFALWKEDDKLVFIDNDIEEASEQFIVDRCSRVIAFIQQRFTGLLGLQARRFRGNQRGPRFTGQDYDDIDAMERRVFYIHRTVRDWLVSADGIHERLVGAAPHDFDAHLCLLRSYVLRMRHPAEYIEHHRVLDDWWPDISLSLTHARHITNDPEHLQRRFINRLDETLQWWWLSKPEDPYDHWARNSFSSFEIRMKATPIWQPLLCLATKFGLETYIREELEARRAEEAAPGVSKETLELQTDDSTPLLTYAIEYICSRNKTMFPLSSPSLIRYLLENPWRANRGANHEYKDFLMRKPITPWLALLKHLRDANRRRFIDIYDVDEQGTSRWAEIVRLFLEQGGADPDAVVLEDMWDPEITTKEVLELLDREYGAYQVKELLELRERKSNAKVANTA